MWFGFGHVERVQGVGGFEWRVPVLSFVFPLKTKPKKFLHDRSGVASKRSLAALWSPSRNPQLKRGACKGAALHKQRPTVNLE